MGTERWDKAFFRMAQASGSLSKDPDRKVGAFLVSHSRRLTAMGYNGFPAFIEDTPERLYDREFKLKHTVHAEANALTHAMFDPGGATLYVTRFPCDQCAARLAAAGVDRVVAPAPDLRHPRWGESWDRALKTFQKAGVVVDYMED